MAGRVRAFDWASTTLGAIDGWDDRLRGAAEMVLAMGQMATLAIGPDRLFLFNDEAARHYGPHRAALLGLPLGRAFAHEYAQVAAFYDRVFAGESLHIPDQPLDPARTGVAEVFDAWLSPVRDRNGAVIAALMTGAAIGDRRRAEAALRESRQRFQALVTAGTYTTYRMSADWRVMFQLDSDTLDPTADPIEDWVGKYIPPDERPAVHAAIARAIRTRSPFDLEHRVNSADGGIAWVHSRAVPLLDERGAISEWFGVGSDVTDRRAATERLRTHEQGHRLDLERQVRERTAELASSRDLLRGTMDASPDMIQVFRAVRDEAGAITDFVWILNNAASEAHYGEVRGQSLLDRNPGVVAEGIFDKFRRVTETGVPEHGEHRYVHEQFDGWFYQSVVRFEDGVATTTKSISDWKAAQADILRLQAEAAAVRLNESEDRFRTLADTAPAMIWQNGTDGGNLFVNRFLLDYTGRSEAEIAGLQWRDLVHPDHLDAYVASYMAAVRERRPWRNRNRVRRHDGAWHWFDNVAQPLFAQDGRYLGHVGVSTDIQAAVDAEGALRDGAAQQAFLLHLSDALGPIGDPAEVQDVACRLLAERLDVDRACYVAIDEAAGTAVVERDFVRGGVGSLAGRHRLADFGWAVDSLRRGTALVIADTQGSEPVLPADRSAAAAAAIVAGMGAPLVSDGRLVGALCVTASRPRAWREAEVALLAEAGQRIRGAMERAGAEAAAELLRGLADRIVTEEDSGTINDEVLAAAIALARADAGSIRLLDPETQGLDLLAIRGFPAGVGDPSGQGDAAVALDTGQRTFVDLAERGGGAACRPLVDHGLRTALALPLVSRTGRRLGLLTTYWRVAGHRSGERELRFMDLIARQAADLIEQRRAQQVLRASEERLRQFGEASQDILWIRDADTLQWVYLTPAFEKIYGLGRAEALAGDSYRNWQELILPEDRDRATACIARVVAGERATFEYRVRRPSDGTVRWLRNTDFPITDAAGKVVLIGGVGHDFTEVREAEQRMRTLVEGMPQLVWRAVDRGEWVWASPQWCECTGQTQAGYSGWGWLAALHPDDRDAARTAWSHAVEQGGFEVEYRIRRDRDATYRWFQTRATPVRDSAGAITEWIGTSTDIDELRGLQELQKMLLAELQHRVRNILAVTRSIISRSDDGERPTEDYVQHLQGRISALARTQVLLTRRTGLGIDLEDLIRDELLVQAASEDQFTLAGPEVQLEPKAAEVLTLAIHELATNATKYGAFSRTGARLEIDWKVDHREGERWLDLRWTEKGVPILDAAPRRRGFGAELVSRRIPYELKGQGRFELMPGGLHSRIEFPLVAGQSILQTDGVTR